MNPAPRSRRWVVVCGALLFCFGSVLLRAETRVVGTDLLGLDFTKEFYAFAGRTGGRLALAFEGSRSGLEQVKSGRADFALIVLPPAEDGALAALRIAPLGYLPVTVLAPEACPIERISLPQLADVFGVSENTAVGGGLSRWREVGATGEWADRVIMAVLPATGKGITAEYFRQSALGGRPLRSNVERFLDDTALALEFRGNSRTLAIVGGAQPAIAGAKSIAVSTDATHPAFLPTAETLHAGTYPLALAVRIVFLPDRTDALKPWLSFLFSEEAARALAKAGVVALPPTARHEQARAMIPIP